MFISFIDILTTAYNINPNKNKSFISCFKQEINVKLSNAVIIYI